MRDIRCLFGIHEFTGWVEVGQLLKGKCSRCGEVEILDFEANMEYLSKDYPEVVTRGRELYRQIDEFKQLKCAGIKGVDILDKKVKEEK